ncbi:GNAT family N-acetyltransferase [Niabella sp. CC-SYL272]|uniref:GNAT family N-acetyltransferase n=1 Tax=Niabella agricola TaxID=2891571 RepID=UPI001F187CA4|nr:GNAT family N-acetyltransferase [Niabella agricola]MCF3107522.1 GNAT family N-acetyltransferase [Niabella agricola]
MTFPEKYICLSKNRFSAGAYAIVPIRYEDRELIMRWRNEQIYHLRQKRPLTGEDQEHYFQNIVANLFNQDQPEQILFSYLKDGQCIGYGGLVHINWHDQNAEISFIMQTELEATEFHKHWAVYLGLLERVAFQELNLHKIYTYAFDLRPHLYAAIEATGFIKEAELKEHCLYHNRYLSVIIHSKLNTGLTITRITPEDKQITFDWANDTVARANSFNSEPIAFETHSTWFDKKLSDKNCIYYICKIDNKPAGLVRFDKNGTDIIIGITIDQHFRGRNLASKILTSSCKMYLSETGNNVIYAYIKKENIASVKSFERAGFTFQKEVILNGSYALEYLYEKE